MINFRYKKLNSGRFSIYLDYTVKDKDGKSHREYEFLKIHISKDYSRSKRIIAEDKPLMELAQSIRSKRELELYGTVKGLNASSKRVNVSLIDFAKKEVERLNQKSVRFFVGHLERFAKGKDVLFSDVNVSFIENLALYLKKSVSHNTAILYLGILKTLLNRGIRQEIIAVNPFIRYKIPVKQDTDRTYLELHEIKALNETACSCEPHIQQAFLFSCFTGLRFSDIITLKKKHIQLEKDKDGKPFHTLLIRPIKTTRTSGKLLKAPLSEQAVKILKEVKSSHNSEFIFDMLPQKNVVNFWLKKWTKLAGVSKSLHFHAARHTFATLCLTSGVDIYTVSKLLGHTRIDATQIYAKIIDEKKLREVQKFPVFMERKNEVLQIKSKANKKKAVKLKTSKLKK